MLAIDNELGNWNLYIMGVGIPPLKQAHLTPLPISTPISKIKGVNEMIVKMQYILKLVKNKMQSAKE
jgi:hypothetical protein